MCRPSLGDPVKRRMANLVANSCAAPSWANWRGSRVAFLGDSITDEAHIGCTVNYWGVLERDTGLLPIVLGRNGAQWCDLPEQIRSLAEKHGGAVDAIFVFAGTNDFNASVPLGDWFMEEDAIVDRGHGPVMVRRRKFSSDAATFRGRVNNAMSALKDGWPDADIFLLTPIHRGYAAFGPGNVQPDESHSNEVGLFIDDYVQAIREAGNIWAASVIDLNAESGLFPLLASHSIFFHDAESDMLHPGDRGHERIARAIERRLGMATAP